MKVICIHTDTKSVSGRSYHSMLTEGETYTVVNTDKFQGKDYYFLSEIEIPNVCFVADLFIPCSSIDENEMQREYNLTVKTNGL